VNLEVRAGVAKFYLEHMAGRGLAKGVSDTFAPLDPPTVGLEPGSPACELGS